MKFGKDVLLEIVDVVRRGIAEQKDVSQMLREVDVVVSPGPPEEVVLSQEYFRTRSSRDWE